jgi:APA family basic amino acid/polyamine antiporter
VVLAVVIFLLNTVADLRHATGFSSSGVFVDYLVANIAAFTHPVDDRRCPKARQAKGALAFSTLVVTLSPASVLSGVGVFFVGILLRAVRLRQQR